MMAQTTVEDARWKWRGFWVLLLLSAVLVAPISLHWRESGDFDYHNRAADRFADDFGTMAVEVPNFLYHVLVGLPPSKVTGISPFVRGAIVMILSAMATGAILYWHMCLHAKPSLTRIAGIVGAILAFLVVAPINFLTPDNLYFGYFPAHVYHNPTMNMMKPFALLLFFWLPRLYDENFRPRLWGWWLVAYALLTLLGILAKPSFIMAALPALALVSLYRLLRRGHVHWVLLIGGVVVPAVGLLFYQTFTLTSLDIGGGIRFEPLRVFFEWTLHYDKFANVGLIEKLLLSIAFPLVVYMLYWRETWRDLTFNLAWLTLMASLAYSYLLVDEIEIAAGNFTWSAQFAVLLMFAVALITLVKHHAQPLRQHWRMMASLAVLGLHLMAGVHWYILHMTQPYDVLIFRWW